MAMPRVDTDWTVERLNALPDDGNRYEVIDGELFVTPAPNGPHQRAVIELCVLLAPYARSLRLDLLAAPFAVTFSDRREVQPDLLVMPPTPDGKYAIKFADVGRLLLAVEVLSKSTKRTDRTTKRDLYQSEDVSEYWIVNTDDRTVTRWRTDSTEPEVFTTTMQWQPIRSHDALTIDLVAYLRNVFWE